MNSSNKAAAIRVEAKASELLVMSIERAPLASIVGMIGLWAFAVFAMMSFVVFAMIPFVMFAIISFVVFAMISFIMFVMISFVAFVMISIVVMIVRVPSIELLCENLDICIQHVTEHRNKLGSFGRRWHLPREYSTDSRQNRFLAWFAFRSIRNGDGVRQRFRRFVCAVL